MKYAFILGLCFWVACTSNQYEKSSGIVGGACDGCDLFHSDIPETIRDTCSTKSWDVGIKPFIITGTVYDESGKNKVPNTIIYFWHTDVQGVYPEASTSNPHGTLRGWVVTNAEGNYTIKTSKPGAYPLDSIPAHVHMFVKEPNLKSVYYIDDIYFGDDTMLSSYVRNNVQENRGGNGIVNIQYHNDIPYVQRDIYLGRNIPNYPK